MSEYEVGYGKPPIDKRYKPGVSGNPHGRPKRQPNSLVESILNALNSPIKYRERGRMRSATGGELAMRMVVDRAATGDPLASKTLLKALAQAERSGDGGVDKITIKNWLAIVASGRVRQRARGEGQSVDANVDNPPRPANSEPEAN